MLQNEIQNIKYELNQKIENRYKKHTSDMWQKNQEKVDKFRNTILEKWTSDLPVEKAPFEYQWDYVELQEFLADHLIRID